MRYKGESRESEWPGDVPKRNVCPGLALPQRPCAGPGPALSQIVFPKRPFAGPSPAARLAGLERLSATGSVSPERPAAGYPGIRSYTEYTI